MTTVTCFFCCNIFVSILCDLLLTDKVKYSKLYYVKKKKQSVGNMKNWSFLNKFVLIAGLLLASQGFAMDAWTDHKSSTAPDSVNNCYQIYTPAELAWFAANVNANKAPYCAKVMADLDMAGYHWIPISAKGTQRAVNFDGNNKIISNLYISAEEILKKYPNDRQYAQNLGLIGAFTGHVQNVILENVEVYAYGNGYVSGNSNYEKSPLSIGTVVGWQANPNSIVENCYVTGKMVTSGDGQAVGGIVGNNGGGTIRNCYSEVNIDASGTAYVGGIAGYTKAYTSGAVATISSCVYAGNTLSSTGAGAAGAIVGNHYDGTTAFENVYYDSDNFGGSVGRTMAGDTTGSPTGASELNSALIACTLNGGEMVDGVCTKDSPWSSGASSICLNGYGADGYKITFNANGGSFAGGATFVKYVKAGNTINNDGVANPSWGDDSYVFAGWSGDDYNKAATKATTITADWNKMHTITFSPVNGDLHGTFPDGSSESVSIKIEDGKRIAVQGFERPTTFTDAQNVKYNFMGWAFAESPTTALVAEGLDNLPLATRDTTLLAVWTTAPVYTVSFYANGSTTASYVSTVYQNDKATALTVDKMDPHPGYTFNGWFESGASTSFDFDQDITADVNLYAQWEKNSYTVNYVLNCSNECTNSNGDAFTVDGMPLSDPEWNESHRFLGWYADAEFKDKKTSIPSGLTDDITLYAEWETITYDITYRAGAYGTGLVAAEKKIHNEAYTLREASYTRKGYLQSGWVSEEGLTYAFGDEYSANAPLIVYPTWDTISYTITYECNGCDVSDNKKYPKSFNVESKFSIEDPASISAEYKFGGWFKNAEFSGNKNPNVAKGTTGDFTFYGKWNKIYKITYVLNGSADDYNNDDYTVDDEFKLNNPAPVDGYIFGGWYDNANFEGDAVTGIAKGSTGDTTFYAKWIPESIETQYGAITITESTTKVDGEIVTTRTAAINGNYGGGDEPNLDETDAVEISSDITVNSVTLNRTFNAGKVATLYVPFEIDAENVVGTEVYKFKTVVKSDEDNRWKFKVSTATKIMPNTPYVIIPAGSQVTFNITEPVALNTTTEGEATAANNWEFVGAYQYEKFTLDNNNPIYLFANEERNGAKLGEFVKIADGAYINPMRAYLVYNKSAAMQKSARGNFGSGIALPDELDIEIENENGIVVQTGTLNTVTGEVRMDRWFDLKGRRLNAKPTTKGTYYKNGERVIIK